MHRSSAAGVASNERLEFLGDSVLGAVVTAYITERYPDSSEGFLTNLRSQLVRGSTLATIARKLDVAPMVVLAADMEAVRDADNVLEDAFEALVGAVFTDRGFEATRAWLVGVYEKHVDMARIIDSEFTPRDRLAAVLRRRGEALDVESDRIADGFRAIVKAGGHVLAVGEADARKTAVDEACKSALRYLSTEKI